VNTPPPKGGGFELRLKAGSVRRAADSDRNSFESASYAADLSSSLYHQRRDTLTIRPAEKEKARHHYAVPHPMPPEGVGFADPLSGTLKNQCEMNPHKFSI